MKRPVNLEPARSISVVALTRIFRIESAFWFASAFMLLLVTCLPGGVEAKGLNFGSNSERVTGNVRAVAIGGRYYPDTALFIPNSFVSGDEHRAHMFLHYVNRVRKKHLTYGCQPDCSDAEINFEFKVFGNVKHSLVLLPVMQSLTSRNSGTPLGDGLYLGFRFSKQLSDTLAFSIGGENLKRFDSSADLGRNAFIGFSKAFALGGSPRPNIVANIGLGSGIFSMFGNTLIKTGYTSEQGYADNFDFGLVGSLSYFHSPRLAVGIEYSGYGLGIGPSVRPFSNLPLTATFYIYDWLLVPDAIRWRDQATPNLFANISYSF